MRTTLSLRGRSTRCALALLVAIGAASAAGLAHAAAPQTACSGTFSDGTSVNPAAPVYRGDVPGMQTFCDFHTFAWNQFLYFTQSTPDPRKPGVATPRFMQLAPWYNVLKPNGSPKPGSYPGGDTSLAVGHLSKTQAGDDDHLVDARGSTVLYDIRFNAPMYQAIVNGGLYTANGFDKACAPDKNGNCTGQVWLPPLSASQPPTLPGSMEVKTAWRDFGSAGACPAEFYCNGRFGLVGMHLVQKTVTHGEWIWASFEHVANAPDCVAGGDTPIAPMSPLGTAWSFFNPATAGPTVMSQASCPVAAPAQCNTDPRYSITKRIVVYKPVNVCRTAALPAGGANAQNCAPASLSEASNAGNVACLNATLQPQRAGVWKNYKLIGSLWIQHKTGPEEQFWVQGMQSPVPGVRPGNPVGFPHLANTTMETFLQPGATGYDPAKINASQASCFTCHNLPSSAGQFPGADLSHFPGKLPKEKLNKFLKSLVRASSTAAPKDAPAPVSPPTAAR